MQKCKKLLRGDNPNIFPLFFLDAVNFGSDAHHPAVLFDSASSLEHHSPSMDTQRGHMFEDLL